MRLTFTRPNLTFTHSLRSLFLGKPLSNTPPVDDSVFRWAGILFVSVFSFAYDLNITDKEELLDKQLTPYSYILTLLFVYLNWHLNLQVFYFERARFSQNQVPTIFMLKRQVIKGFFITSGLCLLFTPHHLFHYGYTLHSLVLGANFFLSAQIFSAVGCLAYFLIYGLRPRKEFSLASGHERTITSADLRPAKQIVQPTIVEMDAITEIKPQKLQVDLTNKTVYLEEDQIEHVSIEDRVVFVTTTEGQKLITRYITLAEFTVKLSEAFFRVNRQLVVHHSTVLSAKKQNYGNLTANVKLGGKETQVNVSRYKAQEFLNWMEQYTKG